MTRPETYISETKAIAELIKEGFTFSHHDKYMHKGNKKARIIQTGQFQYKAQIK